MERIDIEITRRGLCETREQAKKLLLSGQVLVNEKIVDKPGTKVSQDAQIRLKKQLAYVSRGGDKLASVYDSLSFPIQDLVFMDVGSSTGGFTDFLLQNGARKVYSVDVGTNQLAWKLRQDPRVSCLENTHISKLEPNQISDPVCGFVIDVSFISLTRVIPVLFRFAQKEHFIVPMIKPQFEVGRQWIGKNGVVRDEKAIENALLNIFLCLHQSAYQIHQYDFSRLPGPKGNVEYFLYASYTAKLQNFDEKLCRQEIQTLIDKKNTWYKKSP